MLRVERVDPALGPGARRVDGVARDEHAAADDAAQARRPPQLRRCARSTAYTFRSTLPAVDGLAGHHDPAGEAPAGLGTPDLGRGVAGRRLGGRATGSAAARCTQAALTLPRRRARLNAPCDIPLFTADRA